MTTSTMSLTVHEAALRLGVSDYTIRGMLRDGRLSGFKLRRQWRVPESSVLKYIEENSNDRSQS